MPSFHQVIHKDGSSGDIVQCSHDPCSLHGELDIHADTLEEAYDMLYQHGHDGMSMQGGHHPHITRRIFQSLKKTAVPFLMVAMMSSLSACGASQGYDNSSVLDNPSPATSQSSSPYASTDDAARQPNGSSGTYDKAKAKEYSEKAKNAYESMKSKSKGYIDELESSSDSLSSSSKSGGSGADGVPSSLAANTDITMADLKSLKVVANHGRSSSYNRKEWSDSRFAAYGSKSCWSVRDEVIKRQADPGTLKISPDGCSVEAVSFTDPYSGKKISEGNKKDVAKNIQIDHMVPVSYMNSNGGSSWDSAMKAAYYNDMDMGHLIAVSSEENSIKSDSGPSGYLPPAGGKYSLAYAQDWVSVIRKYESQGVNATIEQSDYDAIMKIFDENNVR